MSSTVTDVTKHGETGKAVKADIAPHTVPLATLLEMDSAKLAAQQTEALSHLSGLTDKGAIAAYLPTMRSFVHAGALDLLDTARQREELASQERQVSGLFLTATARACWEVQKHYGRGASVIAATSWGWVSPDAGSQSDEQRAARRKFTRLVQRHEGSVARVPEIEAALGTKVTASDREVLSTFSANAGSPGALSTEALVEAVRQARGERPATTHRTAYQTAERATKSLVKVATDSGTKLTPAQADALLVELGKAVDALSAIVDAAAKRKASAEAKRSAHAAPTKAQRTRSRRAALAKVAPVTEAELSEIAATVTNG